MSHQPTRPKNHDPDVIEFGIAALDAHLDGVELEYPVTGSIVIEKLDDPEIPIDAHGDLIRLSEAIEEIDDDRFETKRELQNALHPVFESRRGSARTGALTGLRALLPF